MPYLPTSQAFLEQSALLLQAYPESRITTKYSYPTERRAQQAKRQKSQDKQQNTPTANSESKEKEEAAPVASLVLKTYHPSSGITLKYRTNKHQEVGRLMTGLGKLAGGADVAGLGLSGAGNGNGNTGDVEMGEAEDTAGAGAVQGAATSTPAPAGGKTGGKGKKKGGKGKR